jgi:hypothetical protein
VSKKSPSVEEFIPEDDRPSVNTRLLATIAKAMMKKKEERFKDAPDMLQAIAQVSVGLGVYICGALASMTLDACSRA